VAEVLRAVPAGRRRLEVAFRRALGRTIMQELRRIRVERARYMLTSTSLTMTEIALRCGFSSLTKFDAAFRREMGMTPSRFRRGTVW
jgi:LacI family transcriptional regulator